MIFWLVLKLEIISYRVIIISKDFCFIIIIILWHGEIFEFP